MCLVKTIGSVLLSGVVGFGGALLVNTGYDWGYLFATKLAPGEACNQGYMALVSLPYLIFPLIAFWSLGYLTRAQHVWLPLLTAGAGMAAIYHSAPIDGTGLANLVWPLVAAVTALCSCFTSRNLFQFLQGRMNASVIYRPAAIVAGLASLVSIPFFIFDWDLHPSAVGELGFYAVCLGLLGYVTARAAKAKGTTGGAFAGVLAALPILMANALNIGGNILSLGLDQLHIGANLGPSALLSAAFIGVCGLIACIAGGGMGAIIDQRVQSNSARI
jgi:hypothetical protein